MKEWIRLGEDNDMNVQSVKVDLRVGGKFRIQLKDDEGEYFTAAGTYLEVKPPERLVYTWDWEKDGGSADFDELEGKETLLTVEFRAIGTRTQFTMTHEKFTEVERRDRHIQGWGMWMDRLATFVTTQERKP
jgi:uncharacterized protein YndB with AHSA1/START domain